MSKISASFVIVVAIGLVLSGCAGGGDPCRSAGHAPGSPGYSACESKRADDQARGARKIANDMPLRGYGPIGRF